MRTKVTLVLVFLNVALFFYIFRFERGWETERELRETRTFVLGPETANLQSLEISGPAVTQTIRLERLDGAWRVTQPISWPANEYAVSTILLELQRLESRNSFAVDELSSIDQSLASYGLDQPRLTIAYTTAGGESGSLRLGGDTADQTGLYALSPDGERIHVVGRSIATSVTQGVDALRDPRIFTTPDYEARTLRITGSSPRATQVKRNGEQWDLDSPINARASRIAMLGALNDLNSLRVNRFVASPPQSAFPESGSGFTLRISVEGNGRVENVQFGNPMGPADAAGTVEYYARKESETGTTGSAQVFTVVVPGTLLNTLRNAQVALRETKLLPDLDVRDVNSISLGNPDTVLELQRLEIGSTSDGRAAWNLIARGTGAPAAPQAADTQAVQALLDRLKALSAREFSSDAPLQNQLEDWGLATPTTVSLGFATTNGVTPPKIVLKLGSAPDGSSVHAQVGDLQPYVYEVGPEIVSAVSLDRNAWRDRLLRALSNGERITAIEITDLASNTSLASETYPPATGAMGGNTPVAALAVQLRTLRASSLQSEAFDSMRVLVNGFQRTWRYRVTLTVAQVAGAGVTQESRSELYFTERLGGSLQRAGSSALGIWQPDQPLVDALSRVIDAPRDPGPPPEAATPTPAN